MSQRPVKVLHLRVVAANYAVRNAFTIPIADFGGRDQSLLRNREPLLNVLFGEMSFGQLQVTFG